MLGKIIRKRSAGQFVPGGVYWNAKAWELASVPEEGDYLPAGEGTTYYQVPVLLVLALGPVAGLAFILFLPLAVPLLAVYAAGKAAAARISRRHQKGLRTTR